MKYLFSAFFFYCLSVFPVSAQINKGLIAYWNFCDCSATDKSGNGYNGTLIRNPQCIDGISGKALDFSKADRNYIIVPKDIKLNTPEYTIAAWFNASSLPGGSMSWAPIISRMYNSNDPYGDAYCLTLDQNGNIWYFHNGQGENFGNTIQTQKWYFLVIAVSNGVGKAFLNNELIDSFSTSLLNSADSIPICIGCNDYNQSIPNHFFNGALDEIRIYNREIKEQEITELYSLRAADPQLVITPENPIICQGDSIVLNATGNVSAYNWSPATGLSCTDCLNPVATPLITTKYTFTANDPEGCEIIQELTVIVDSVSLTIPEKLLTIKQGETKPLTITTNANSIKWTPSLGLDCDTCKIPNASPDTTTTYYINVISTKGCTKIDSILVMVNAVTPCSKISGIINNYSAVTQISNSKLFVTVSDATGFKKDDQVLFIQMQGAQIDTTNTSGYGMIKDIRGAGDYEFAIIEGVSGNTVTFTKPLTGEKYDVSGKIQLVTVPEYSKAIVRDSLTCAPWNGTTGGILALSANCIALEGKIDVSGRGFRGGEYRVDPCNPEISSGIYVTSDRCFASKGEGIAGYGIENRTLGRGAPANGGGGGNSHNGGGGGGSNSAKGGNGGFGYIIKPNSQVAGGIGGGPVGIENYANKVFMGGGGGAGQINDGHGSAGGNGGGIVIIRANIIENEGNFPISTNGADALNDFAPVNPDGCGGGGAGGSIVIDDTEFTSTLPLEANGGNGGSRLGSAIGHGTGGGGSGGFIRFANAGNHQTNVMRTYTGGKAGTALEGGTYGAADGQSGMTHLSSNSFANPIIPGEKKLLEKAECKTCYPTIETAQQLCSPATFIAKDDIYPLQSIELDNTQSENVTMQLSGSLPSNAITGTLTLIDPTKPGKFLLRAVNEDDNSVTYGSQVYPAPSPSVNSSGANLSAINTQPNDVLQWYYNGAAITGATGKNHKAANSGEYHLEVTNIYGCKGTSAKVWVTISGINDNVVTDEFFALYPNPTADQLYIESKNIINEQLTIELTNILGESAFKTDFKATGNSFKTSVSLKNLPSGTYYVHISSGTFKKVYKIVRN